jgi:hypothetical protein
MIGVLASRLQRLADELRRISAECSGGTIAERSIIEALSP